MRHWELSLWRLSAGVSLDLKLWGVGVIVQVHVGASLQVYLGPLSIYLAWE